MEINENLYITYLNRFHTTSFNYTFYPNGISDIDPFLFINFHPKGEAEAAICLIIGGDLLPKDGPLSTLIDDQRDFIIGFLKPKLEEIKGHLTRLECYAMMGNDDWLINMPFGFEGKRRFKIALKGFEHLKSITDMIVMIPNNALISYPSPSSMFFDAFKKSDEIAHRAVKAFSDILLTPRMLAMDFTDIKRAFPQGLARIGIGRAKESRPMIVVREAIRSPFSEGMPLRRAGTVICNMNLSGSETIEEIHDAFCLITEQSHKEADFFSSTQIDQKEKTVVTLIAGDFEAPRRSLMEVFGKAGNE